MMKRLMSVSVILVCGMVQADNTPVVPPVTAPATTQSHDDTSKKSDSPAISISNVHQIDLDTTEVDGSGNWFNKRLWYTKAQNIFNGIRTEVSALVDLRIKFSNEVNGISQKLDSFFERVNFVQGQLDEKFKELLIRLDAQQKMVGDLSVQERQLQTTIKQEQSAIDQIERDMKSIGEVDEKINQTLAQALKTIDECRDYETKSWDAFQSIGKELDDKKARTMYYQISNYKQNIEQKNNYLQTTLLPYLHNVLIAKIDANITKINAAIEQLKAKGLDIEKIMNKEQEEDVARLHEHEKEATAVAVKKAIDEAQEKAHVAAQKAEEESEKALKLANEKSFNNVVNRYYQQTIGKIVGFVHQGYVGVALDAIGNLFTNFFAWYSYPVATYVYHKIIGGKIYMQHKVENIVSYFSGKPSTLKKEITEKAELMHENDEVKDQVAPEVKDHLTKNIQAEHPVIVDQHAAVQPAHVTQPIITHPEAVASQPVHVTQPADTKIATDHAEHHDVVVQSLQDDQADQKPQPTNLYRLFASLLNFFAAIFMSIYTCIAHFFSLIMHVSAYIHS